MTMEMQAAAPPSSKIPTAVIEKAVNGLIKWKSDKSTSEKAQLLPSDDFLYLVLTLTKIPAKSRVNAFKIPLPHPLYTPENSELCLFVADNNSKVAKSKVEDDNLPIAQVIKLTKLKKEYKAHEQKRKLCDSYDLFFAEKRIVPLLPNAIGKAFYKKKKVPVPVELGRTNWKDQIDRVCSSAMLYLSTGSCSVVKVARASMERGQIVENVVAAMEGIANVVPKKWGNIRSFNLKFSESVSLPVYQKVPDIGFKIAAGMMSDSGVVKKAIEEAKKEGAGGVVKMKAKKKGRIHELRYMDEGLVGEDEAGNESEGEEVVDQEEEEEVVVEKKRKSIEVEKKVKKKGDKGLMAKKDSSAKKSKKSKVSV